MNERRIFFVRKAGRVTGPFSRIRLKAMLNEGSLSKEDLFSQDKRLWAPLRDLFPSPEPKAETEPPQPREEPAPERPEDSPGETPAAATPASNPPGGQPLRPSAPEAGAGNAPSPEPPRVQPQEQLRERPLPEKGFVRFLHDTGSVIALVWDFDGQLPVLRGREVRAAAAALVLNLLPAVLGSFFFGRSYSRSFHPFLSPLMGALTVLVICLLTLTAAWIIAEAGLPSGKKRAEEWLLFGIGLFMNYGMLGGTAIALIGCFFRQGRFVPGGAVLICVLVAAVCGATGQTASFLERFRGIPRKWSFPIVPLLTAVTATAGGLLITLI